MKPTVVSLALAVRMGSVPASVRAAVPCRRCRRETLSRFILSRFMNVLLLAGERLRRPPPSRGMVGWAVFRGRCGDFARVVPAAGGDRSAQIILKSQDFTRAGDFMQKCAPMTVPKQYA